jgi:hypothetical protein
MSVVSIYAIAPSSRLLLVAIEVRELGRYVARARDCTGLDEKRNTVLCR